MMNKCLSQEVNVVMNELADLFVVNFRISHKENAYANKIKQYKIDSRYYISELQIILDNICIMDIDNRFKIKILETCVCYIYQGINILFSPSRLGRYHVGLKILQNVAKALLAVAEQYTNVCEECYKSMSNDPLCINDENTIVSMSTKEYKEKLFSKIDQLVNIKSLNFKLNAKSLNYYPLSSVADEGSDSYII